MAGIVVGGGYNRPKPAEAVQTQVINGQTYTWNPNTSFASGVAGRQQGLDGSITGFQMPGGTWSAMPSASKPAGASGGSGGGSGAGPAYEEEDFDFYGALAKARSAVPQGNQPVQSFARVEGATPADAAAAQSAQFARAKDRIGSMGRGSLMALQEGFDARGFGGSGMEASATGSLLSDLQGEQSEVVRDQAIENLVRQRQVEDRNYAGDINQRSQDIGYASTTRGQDISSEGQRTAALVPLMQLIAANRNKRRVLY
jgi:hypothetical protein